VLPKVGQELLLVLVAVGDVSRVRGHGDKVHDVSAGNQRVGLRGDDGEVGVAALPSRALADDEAPSAGDVGRAPP